jgi:hypothetical protein
VSSRISALISALVAAFCDQSYLNKPHLPQSGDKMAKVSYWDQTVKPMGNKSSSR